MCIWYKCSILLMIFIFWSIHGYYIRKEKNLCFSGVCQPNQKLFIDYLPVWGNSNLIFSQCPWCISSYGCWLFGALWEAIHNHHEGPNTNGNSNREWISNGTAKITIRPYHHQGPIPTGTSPIPTSSTLNTPFIATKRGC